MEPEVFGEFLDSLCPPKDILTFSMVSLFVIDFRLQQSISVQDITNIELEFLVLEKLLLTICLPENVSPVATRYTRTIIIDVSLQAQVEGKSNNKVDNGKNSLLFTMEACLYV